MENEGGMMGGSDGEMREGWRYEGGMMGVSDGEMREG